MLRRLHAISRERTHLFPGRDDRNRPMSSPGVSERLLLRLQGVSLLNQLGKLGVASKIKNDFQKITQDAAEQHDASKRANTTLYARFVAEHDTCHALHHAHSLQQQTARCKELLPQTVAGREKGFQASGRLNQSSGISIWLKATMATSTQPDTDCGAPWRLQSSSRWKPSRHEPLPGRSLPQFARCSHSARCSG